MLNSMAIKVIAMSNATMNYGNLSPDEVYALQRGGNWRNHVRHGGV